MTAVPDAIAENHPHLHEIEIRVNKTKVSVLGPETTGLKIKEAAIAAGVPIELSFQLSERLPHHETRVIGDSETVRIHDGSQFVAVAGDDNS